MPSLLRPMTGRDTGQSHRASTPLELFFDLTFVVAVSFLAEGAAQQITDGGARHTVLPYLMVFFAIWWGWLNFTWFASAYDTDDWLYRVVTFVQMGGALTVGAGVTDALDHERFGTVVVGYAIMRLAMVFQWLRAAHRDVEGRSTALRYALGITVVQVAWIARLLLPDGLALASFVVLAAAEMCVPMVAERRRRTTFHPGHIAERYGLFTLIVLGEGILASAKSVFAAVTDGEHVPELIVLAICSLVVLAGMWWFYFEIESADLVGPFRSSLVWGYGHYVVFASAAAVSTGIEVLVEELGGHGEAGAVVAGLSLSVPVGVFVGATWLLVVRPHVTGAPNVVAPVAAVVIAALGLTGSPLGVVAGTAASLALTVTVLVVDHGRRTTRVGTGSAA